MKSSAPGQHTKLIHHVLFIILFILSPVLNATAQPFELAWQEIHYGSNYGGRGLGSLDLAGNGKEEILMSAEYPDGRSYFTILTLEKGRYVQRWRSEFYPRHREIRAIDWADADNDNVYELYVLTDNGSLEIYNGATLERDTTLLDQFDLQNAHPNDTEMHTADVDNDGDIELVIWDLVDLTIFDIASLRVVRDTTYTFRSIDFAIGDVDMDGEQEFVLSGGAVVDGATGQVEWEHDSDFGRQIALVDVDEDGVKEIVGIEVEDDITAFDPVDQSMLWQIDSGEHQETIIIDDLNNDGIDEIIVGNDQRGNIKIYDPRTQEVTGFAGNPDSGTTNLAVGDPDGDGTKEIIWGGNATSTAADHLYFLDIGTMAIEAQIGGFNGPYALDIADTDNDLLPELLTTHIGDGESREVIKLRVFDDAATSLALLDTVLAPFDGSGLIEGVDVNGDDKMDIVVAIRGYIFILDGTTRQVLLDSNVPIEPQLMEVGDIDADGEVEIVLGGNDGQILVLDAQTLETEGAGLDAGQTMNALVLENLDDDPALEIAVLSRSETSSESDVIEVYDGLTQLQEGRYTGIFNARMLIIGDIDLNGSLEFIIALRSDDIELVDVETMTLIDEFSTSEGVIHSMALGNVNSTPEPELIIGSEEAVSIFDPQTRERLWRSEDFGVGERFFVSIGFVGVGTGDQLFVTDFDGDEWIDLIFTSSIGYHWLEATESSDTGGSGTSSEEEAIPQAFSLHQNYPNPFNPVTTITYEVPVASHVTIEVFNLTGQRVSTLQDGLQSSGRHTVTWKADQLSSGVYVYRMHAGSFTATRKVVLLR